MSKMQRYIRRSERTSYLSTVIGISLVLFMLGIVGWLILTSKKVTQIVKESIQVDVFFKEGTREADMLQLEKTLSAEHYVKSARYVSKQEALEIAEKQLGDDSITEPIDYYNPILASIEVFIKEDYAALDSVTKIEANLLAKYNTIEQVYYDRSMFSTINDGARSFAWIILALAALLLFVAVALINNTIRLAVFSKRFLIRSMQLVGATERFIRWPFMLRAFFQGIIAALIALALLLSAMNLAINWIPGLKEVQDIRMILTLFSGIAALGVLISWISTYFALRKYLRIHSDYLY
ncbi:MAG: cell division protein FtsX [Bacteroidota bacterium]